MVNGWRWRWKMEEMVCDVCVEGWNSDLLSHIEVLGIYTPWESSRRILIFFPGFYTARVVLCHTAIRWPCRVNWCSRTVFSYRAMLMTWLVLPTRLVRLDTALRCPCWTNRFRRTAIAYRAVLATRPVLVLAPVFLHCFGSFSLVSTPNWDPLFPTSSL